jgi:four helix bundle protein
MMKTGERKAETVEADFRARTFAFAARTVHFVESLPSSATNRTLGLQLLRSATSVGANARAAKRARSRAEFAAKMGIVEEEIDESSYWIELLIELKKVKQEKVQLLLQEANEILAITIASIKTTRRNAA